MGKLHNIRLRFEFFVSNIDLNIAEAIQSQDAKLTNLNRKQMLNSIDSSGAPLIHKKTGSTLLSPGYAKRKRKSKPNLFDTGAFQKEMFLQTNENDQTYFLTSDHWLGGILASNYGNEIFGIYDKKKAKELTGLAFKKLFNRKVLKK